MSTELTLIFLTISFIGLLFFWLFYRQSNSTEKLSEKYLIQQLKEPKLSDEQRSNFEKQLSSLLQQQSSNQGSKKVVLLVALIAVPFSLFFYNKLGHPSAVDYVPNNQQNVTQNTPQAKASQMNMQDAIKQLEQRLAEDPNNVDGQMLYARSQISLKNYSKAVTAYRKANDLAPNEPVILTELAEAIALANNNRSFLGEPEKLLSKAAELDPNNQKALWLLGMTFYEHQNYKKTNELWSKLYAKMSDEGAKKQLAQQINDLRRKLGLQSLTMTQEPIKALDNKSNLNIKVSLSDELKTNLKGKRALLYIYSKQPTGMPMPIAVIKKPLEQIVKGFPIELTMNDNNSLQPNRKLSDFDRIKIGARISFTGNAMPQAGDLQSDEVVVGFPYRDVIELVIDKVR